jgi:hypothetical protein
MASFIAGGSVGVVSARYHVGTKRRVRNAAAFLSDEIRIFRFGEPEFSVLA